MKRKNVCIVGLILLALVLDFFLLYFYYREVAYPIEDPTKFGEYEGSLADAAVIREYKDEYPFIGGHLEAYLVETDSGDQRIIVLEKFPYFAQYKFLSQSDIPEARPCAVSVDFFGKVYDFMLDEENVFHRTESTGMVDVASEVLMLMPVIGLIPFLAEGAVGYAIYAAIRRKRQNCSE